jgi:hypothetical protein
MGCGNYAIAPPKLPLYTLILPFDSPLYDDYGLPFSPKVITLLLLYSYLKNYLLIFYIPEAKTTGCITFGLY